MLQAVELIEFEGAHAEDGSVRMHWSVNIPWPNETAAGVREDLVKPYAMEQAEHVLARVAGAAVLKRQCPAVWFCRSYRPLTSMIWLLSEVSGVDWDRYVTGRFAHWDYPRLTCAAGQLANAPLCVGDAAEPFRLGEILSGLLAEEEIRLAVFDWTLAGAELRAVREVAARTQMRVVFPG